MRVFAIVALLALAVVAVSARAYTEKDYQKAFTQFVKQYEKSYAHDEFFSRYNVFKTNMQIIAEHNAGNHSYTLAMNEFGDLTFAEFHARYTGYNHIDQSHYRSLNAPKHVSTAPLPKSVDWREKGAVTPIKNQAQCGSCWAFSTTGAVEGGDFIHAGGVLNSLSEQQLVDCSQSAGNQGCNGGLMDNAFQWIKSNGGLCTEAAYPYTAADGSCQKTCSDVGGTKLTGFTDVPQGDETTLQAAVAGQPVSIAIEADQQVFQFYSGGILDDASCGTQLDHGVLLVGYGTDTGAGGKDFWIVKNSWGDSWGEKGYIRFVRGKNQCGVAQAASYPTYGSSKTRHH